MRDDMTSTPSTSARSLEEPFRRDVPRIALGLVMIAVGLATVFYWGSSDYADDIFKALPGMLVPLAVYGLAYGAVRER